MLFGSDRPIDEKQYRLAISSSALEHDLSLLPDGENTEIGERGVTLSGGQKARVALARAVYHRADVCLLDDPLAAVDAHVGRDIFHGCIADGMVGRDGSSVVLVTNAIQHLSHSRVDSILVLKNGTVAERGTYSSLTEDRKSLFSSFLRVMAGEYYCSAITDFPTPHPYPRRRFPSLSSVSSPNKLSLPNFFLTICCCFTCTFMHTGRDGYQERQQKQRGRGT